MSQLKPTRAMYVRYAAIALAIALVLGGGFALLRMWENNQSAYPEWTPEDPFIQFDGKDYVLNENVEAFLVLGLDKFEGESVEDSYVNNQQADFLMLFVFDNVSKQYTAIQINRDTMVPVNVLGVTGNRIDTVVKQIALAHTYGNGQQVSCANTAESVSKLFLGMKIRHYLSVTMDSVPIMNDLVGGVEVEVLDDFSGIDDALVKGERVTLMGEQALTYVRARKGLEDSSNSHRMIRQRQYLAALRDKATARMAADENFAVDATLQMADYMISDKTVQELQALMRKMSEYAFTGMRTIEGESRQGERFMEFYPDEGALEKLVIDVFYQEKEK